MKQAPKPMHPDLAVKVEAEGDKLVKVSFIKEVQYPVWLATVVPKHGQIWVCINFRNLTKACSKVTFQSHIWS